jgi:hypothetical protein
MIRTETNQMGISHLSMRTLDFFRLVAIFFVLLLNLSSKGQSFLYHHPESVFLDTCIFESIQKARIITNTYISKGVFYIDTLSNMRWSGMIGQVLIYKYSC